MKLGNETKNVVSSRKQNSRPRRLSKLLRKKTSLKPKSNDKQPRNLPNTEDNGKTAFVSENTTSVDHTKEYHEHIKKPASELNDMASSHSKEIKSSKSHVVPCLCLLEPNEHLTLPKQCTTSFIVRYDFFDLVCLSTNMILRI